MGIFNTGIVNKNNDRSTEAKGFSWLFFFLVCVGGGGGGEGTIFQMTMISKLTETTKTMS